MTTIKPNSNEEDLFLIESSTSTSTSTSPLSTSTLSPTPQTKPAATFSSYNTISETQTMESCSSWSSSSSSSNANTSLDTTSSSSSSLGSHDSTKNDENNNAKQPPHNNNSKKKKKKKKNPMNLTIQTNEGMETSSLCNSPSSPPLSTPASFASSSAASSTNFNNFNKILQWDSSHREKRILDECWDRILVKQFSVASTTPTPTPTPTAGKRTSLQSPCSSISIDGSLYGRDTVHTRLHQLVVLSGTSNTGKTLLAKSLSQGGGGNNNNNNRMFLYGAPSIYQKKKSMEPLKVFSNMMQQLNGYFYDHNGSSSTTTRKEEAELQLQASHSFGSEQNQDAAMMMINSPQNHHAPLEPLVQQLASSFSPTEQTILVRTFPSLQLFFPKANPKAKFPPTPDIWTRKSPTAAGSYQYQFQVAFYSFLNMIMTHVQLPLIMVMDDFHALDPASLELLDFLLAARPTMTNNDDDSDNGNNRNGILFVLCYTTTTTTTTPRSQQQQQQSGSNHNYYTPHDNNHDDNHDDNHGYFQQKNNLFSTLSYCHERGIKRLPHYDFELTEITMMMKMKTNYHGSSLLNPSPPPPTMTNPSRQLLLALSPLDLQVAKYAACLGVDPIPLDLLEIVYDAFLDHQGGHHQTPKRSKVAPGAHLLFEHLARLISQGILEWKPMQMAMVWANSHLMKEALQMVLQEEEEEEDEKEWFQIIVDGLLDRLTEEQQEYWIYLIADLHNAAGVVVAREIKTANLAKLNQQAALRAIQSGSLLAAGHYLHQAIRALKNAASAKKHHHQALEQTLHRLWMQVSAYTNNDVGLRVAASHLLVEDKQGFLEKLMIHQTQFSGLLSSCSINPNTTHIAQQGANRCFQLLASDLAMKFPTKDLVQGVSVTKGLMKLKSQTRSKNSVQPESRALLKIPIMDKPIQLAAMKLLDTCANFCYMAGDVRFPLVVLKSVELFQKYGLSIYAPMVHALVGVLMVVALDDCKAGIAYANYALTLWTRRTSALEASAVQKALQAQTISLSHFVVLPWANSFSSLLQPLRRAYELAMEGGDIDIAAQTISNYAVLAFLSGRELSILNKELCYYVNQLRRYNRVKWEATCQIWWYVVRKLLPVDRSLPVAPGGMNEEEIMTYVLQTKDEDVLCNFHSAKAMLHTLQGDHQKAADNAVDNSDHIFKTLKGHPLLMVLPFYMGISLYEVAQNSEKNNGNYKKHAKMMLSLAKDYNKKGNPNTAHHYIALEAESHRLGEGRQHLATARKKYEEAIVHVSKAELFQDAALLHHRFGTFYQEHMDNMEASKQHILQSASFVRQWGAKDSVRL